MHSIKIVLLIGIIAFYCICKAESEDPNILIDTDVLNFMPQFDGNTEALNLEKNYQVVGPLKLSIWQDPKTGKFHLSCREEPDGVEERYDITFSQMFLLTGNVEKKLDGKITKYSSQIGWTSEDFKDLRDGDILKGMISAKVAVKKYVIEGLKKDTLLNHQDLTIRVHNDDAPLEYFSLYGLSEKDRDRMWCVVVEIDNGLSASDLEFVKEAEDQYFNLSSGLTKSERYRSIKSTTPTIRAKIKGPYSSGFIYRVDRSEINFDSQQGGSDVFPIDLEVVKYEPRTFEFEIRYEGSGLKGLDHPDQPRLNEKRENSIGMQFVWIPAGKYSMGSKLSPSETSDRYGGIEKTFKNEHPQHAITISNGFWMGCYEVTQLQYKKIMGNNPSNFRFKCPHCDDFLDASYVKEGILKDVGGDHPVDSVSWDDAMAFCKKLSEKEGVQYTLPTEAQWEYACRAGTKSSYFFGDDSDKLKDYGWFEDKSITSTHPVGEKLPNPWGLYDMYGNVSELCLDWYSSDYYSQGVTIDPFNNNPPTGKYKLRVLRGGSIVCPDEHCRSASRDYSFSHFDPDCGQGFRIILNKK